MTLSPSTVTSSKVLCLSGIRHFFRSRAMSRHPVNKYKSAGKFRKQVSRTMAINVRPKPMRGGHRL